MFTGIIETLGTVKATAHNSGRVRLSVDLGPCAEDVKSGDSISINGACLTVAEISGSTAAFDVINSSPLLVPSQGGFDACHPERSEGSRSLVRGEILRLRLRMTGYIIFIVKRY